MPFFAFAAEESDRLLISECKKRIVEYSETNVDSTLYFLNVLDDLSLPLADEVRLYLDLGNAFFLRGNMYLASDNYLKVKEIGYEHKDPLAISAGEISMAGVYLKKGEHRKALDILKEAEKVLLVLDAKDEATLAKKDKYLRTIYLNISNADIEIDNFLEAESYIERAIELCVKNGDRRNEALAYANKSSVLLGTNDAGALEYAYKALKVRQTLGNEIELTKSYRILGDLYSQLAQRDSAKYYLELTLDNSERLGLMFDKYYVAQILKDIYSDEGNNDKAFYYSELYNEAYFEYLEVSNLGLINDLKVQNEISRIESREKERRGNLSFTVLVLVFLLFSIVGFYFALKRKHKIERLENERLVLEKKVIEETLENKNKKLVTSVLHQISRNELIAQIIINLQEFSNELNVKQKASLNKIVRELKAGNDQSILKEFELTFQEVHTKFFKKLDRFYSLTPAERRMAAFIKLNLSSKEISAISGQSVRTIDVTRYRLRKKLDINNTEVNLSTFLAKL